MGENIINTSLPADSIRAANLRLKKVLYVRPERYLDRGWFEL